ncbi:MAG: hypothetical protein ABIG44_15605 [Planctomycetota bacterium]
MRKLLIAGGVFLALLVFLLPAAIFWLRSGPTAPAPAEDPIVRLNREHAGLEDNAADLYLAAFDALCGEEQSSWYGKEGWQRGEPVPEDAAKWVADNGEAIVRGIEAAQRRNCGFQLQRDANGQPTFVEFRQTRTLTKLFKWRARVAAEQGDLETFAESVWMADRIGRHVSLCPWLIAQLVGLACNSVAQTEILQPYTWLNLSAEDRAAYYERVSACYVPPPTLTAAYAFEEKWVAWELPATLNNNPMRFLCPAERISGELARYHGPLCELAEAPVERQANPGDPLHQEIRRLESEGISIFNVPRMFAQMQLPSEFRSIVLHVRMITTQRGNRTVAELFDIRDRTGALPDTLDELAGDFKIDPYTGMPFCYRLTDDGFTLYSAGVDRDDDCGQHHAKFGEGRDGTLDGDYVFWPLPAPESD